MNKQQLACTAVLHWDEVALDARKRMLSTLRQNTSIPMEERGKTAEVLGKRFGVSKGYVIIARKLFKEDREHFNKVLSGEEFFPTRRPKHKERGENSFALYRAYNADGILIYVGKTWSVGQRMNDHARNSKWWDEFSTMTVERGFSSYEDLTSAETLAIRTEKPKYNLEAEWFKTGSRS